MWLGAAGVCFALTTLPCQALDIGRVNVNSARGEPLNALARIRLDSGERIDNSCLSVGDQNDLPDSDHVLISDVQLSLLPSREAIRISTSKPLDLPAVSIVLRVRCADGPLTVRVINLYPKPPSSHASSEIVSNLPGTRLTVRPGDSIYGLSRSIFPHSEKAVRELALAIALANPALFPDGRPRPLRVGELLTIPDLRTVQRIIADSGNSPTAPALPAVSIPPEPQPQAMARQRSPLPSPSITTTTTNHPAKQEPQTTVKTLPSAKGEQRVAARKSVRLRLKLARSINLARSKGMSEAKRAALRRALQPATPANASQIQAPVIKGLELRITQIREVQDGIDAHLTQLEAKVAELQRIAELQETNERQKTIAKRNHIASSAPPAVQPAAPPETTISPVPSRTAEPSPTKPPWWEKLLSWRESRPWKKILEWNESRRWSQSPWLQKSFWWPWSIAAWSIAAVGTLLLLLAALVFRRKFRTRPLIDHNASINSMLQKAREAAGPLLGSEPGLPTGDVFLRPPRATITREETQPANGDRLTTRNTEAALRQPPVLTQIEPSLNIPPEVTPPPAPLPTPYPDITVSAAASDVTTDLRREMDDAIDGSRSMFTDVDRFITLGRVQNAISLLEFQIKRDPHDRPAWVKMLAIYRQEGMDDDFDRTHAAFLEQFKNS